MATRQDIAAVLLPIKPCFAEKIMDGRKRIEFRKIRFCRNVSHVIVYASSPVQRILGYFGISHIDEASPRLLWKRYAAVGGITKSALMDYFANSEVGIAIGIDWVVRMSEPLPVSCLGRTIKVPQSYAYIDEHQFARFIANAEA
jgi:predicted transcriptional regulator